MRERSRAGGGGEGAERGDAAAPAGKRALTDGLARRSSDRDASAAGVDVSKDDVATAAVAAKDPGRAADPSVRGPVEALHGVDLGDVRVHDDVGAHEANTLMSARAFAFGQDVFLGEGEQGSDLGLMAHELTHVVQQGGARRKQVQAQVRVGGASDPAEVEADAAAAQLTGGGSAATTLIVADTAARREGQLGRAEFMAALRAQVLATATAALGPEWSATGCPYIEGWFAEHAGASPEALDRMARRYSRMDAPTGALAFIPAICARLRDGIARWTAGDDVAAELTAAGLGEAGAAAAATPPGGDGTARAMALPGADSASRVVAQMGPGRGLDASTAGPIGDAYGADLSGVRVHTGEPAARLAAREGALAMTVGSDIAFGAGEYAPGTMEGDALLAHELAHVVQQGGDRGTARRSGGAGEAHEADADHAAVGVMSQLWSSGKSAMKRVGPALSAGYEVQRCGGRRPSPAPDPKPLYRTAFNGRWHSHTEATTFDASMGSGGPRTARSRAIFTEVLAGNAAFRTAFDTNYLGFRDYAEIYEFPDPPPAAPPPPPVVPPPVVAPPTGGPDGGTHDGGVPDAGPGPAVPPPVVAPPPPALNAPFLAGITLRPHTATLALTSSNEIQFDPASTVANPGPEVTRHVEITAPAGEVDPVSERTSDAPWAVGQAAGPVFKAHVQPASVATPTNFVARLSIPSEPTFTPQTATMAVTDTRQTWLQSNVTGTVRYQDENTSQWFPRGGSTHAHYYGGQLSVDATTALRSANPNLRFFLSAQVNKNGTAVGTLPRVPFASNAQIGSCGSVIVLEGATPPAPGAWDLVEVTTQYFTAASGGTAFWTEHETVPVEASVAAAPGAAAAMLAGDESFLRTDVLPYMQRVGAPPNERGIASLVAGSRLRMRACMIRPDSAQWVSRQGGRPASQVAWYMGDADDAHTMIDNPGAAAWTSPTWRNDIFLNVTTNMHTGSASRRGVSDLATSAGHEGVHAADIPSVGSNVGDWTQYQKEFRAYWIQGMGAGQNEGQLETAPPVGPRSQRANTIFRHLYGNATYPYVKPAYDADTDGFRQKVDAYFHPDGVNLLLSLGLFDLERAIETYDGVAANYAAKKADIIRLYTALQPADRDEVHHNNQWQRLVSLRFPDPTQRSEIWTELTRAVPPPAVGP